MWTLSLPWWEFILSGIIVYVFLLLILRLTGKRQIGQLAPFDLVLLLVLSNAVQNSMNGGDNSVTGGIIAATTLVIANGGGAGTASTFLKILTMTKLKTAVIGAVIVAGIATPLVIHQQAKTKLRGGNTSRRQQDNFPRESWAFAGYATPDAALQTFTWAMSQGDAKAILASVPEEMQKMLQESMKGKSVAQIQAQAQTGLAKMTGYRILSRKTLSQDETLLEVAMNEDNHATKMRIKRINGH